MRCLVQNLTAVYQLHFPLDKACILPVASLSNHQKRWRTAPCADTEIQSRMWEQCMPGVAMINATPKFPFSALWWDQKGSWFISCKSWCKRPRGWRVCFIPPWKLSSVLQRGEETAGSFEKLSAGVQRNEQWRLWKGLRPGDSSCQDMVSHMDKQRARVKYNSKPGCASDGRGTSGRNF